MYLLHQTLDNTPINFLDNEKCLSEEQVPSVPLKLLNGKPEVASFTFGSENTWYPVE